MSEEKPSKITVCCPTTSQSTYALHPRIYITLSPETPEVKCEYCSHIWRYEDVIAEA